MEQVYLVTGMSAAQSRVESLVREHQTKLARYVRRMVGDADVALDIAQDVFFSAYRTLQKEPERPLTAGWLYKTATNTAISYLRRRRSCASCPSIAITTCTRSALTSAARPRWICKRR